MARRKSNTKRLQNALSTAHEMATQDQLSLERSEANSQIRKTVFLSQIRNREEDTRDLNQTHVAALSESIAVLGLLEPLVLDRRNTLLAGGHRLASIKFLKEVNNDAYEEHFPEDLIPVRVMPFDAKIDPERALQCEVAENEHRRDYTPKEVKALAERLKLAGYCQVKGRPRKGKKALMPALEVIVGKHTRTIHRYLSEEDYSDKNMTNVRLSAEIKSLQRIQRDLKAWKLNCEDVVVGNKRSVLLKKIPSLLRLIDKVIMESASEEENSDL